MATQELIQLQRDSLGRVQTLVERDLGAFWRTLDLSNPVAVGRALTEHIRDLEATYGEMSAMLAAQWYESVRDEAGASGSFVADLAEDVDPAKATIIAKWATGPLWAEIPDPLAALSRATGGTQRLVHSYANETVEENVARDKAATGRFSRDARPNGCAFCQLVASRGPVYRSRETAGDGRKFHDHCYCVVVPDFGDYEEPEKVTRFLDDYNRARERAGSPRSKDILREIRAATGAA